MKKELLARSEAFADEARTELSGYLELLRDLTSKRLDEIDTGDVRRRADRVSERVTEAITDAIVDSIDTVRDRIRPRRRHTFPTAAVAISGALVGAGIAVFFLGRRQEVRERFTDLTGEAQRQLPQVLGRVRRNGHTNGRSASDEESQLRQAVESALFAGEPPPGEIRVDVEGRTVYLRGHLPDRGYVDAAVQKAQAVEGVAAVINLVSA